MPKSFLQRVNMVRWFLLSNFPFQLLQQPRKCFDWKDSFLCVIFFQTCILNVIAAHMVSLNMYRYELVTDENPNITVFAKCEKGNSKHKNGLPSCRHDQNMDARKKRSKMFCHVNQIISYRCTNCYVQNRNIVVRAGFTQHKVDFSASMSLLVWFV